MRAILFTEELMGVALKFSKKSDDMGSLSVSWEDPEKGLGVSNSINNNINNNNTKNSNRKTFRRRILTGIFLCLLTVLVAAILVFSVVCSLDSSSPIHLNPPSSISDQEIEPRRVAALQGLGTMFRRGSRSMNELLIAHVPEDVRSEELRMFLRVLHRSGLGSRADVVLLFPGDSGALKLASVVDEETRNYQRLLFESGCLPGTSTPIISRFNESGDNNLDSFGPRCIFANPDTLLPSNSSLSRLNLEAFVRAEERADSALLSKGSNLTEQRSPRSPSKASRSVPLGAIMAFDIAELDPLDTFSGFIEHAPIQLRRWLSYQMLLGMAKQRHHRYTQVLISQVRGVFLFGDSLIALSRKHKDSRGLVLVTESRTWLEDSTESSKKVSSGGSGGREILSEPEDSPEDPEENPENSSGAKKSKKRSKRRKKAGLIEEVYGRQVWGSIERADKAGWDLVSSAVLAGGNRAVRVLADSVATEIARAAMIRKNNRTFSDQAALNYVVRRNVNLLGQKVVDKLMFADGGGGTAAVRVVSAVPHDDARYDVVVFTDCDEYREQLVKQVVDDLCSSPRERLVYNDCRENDQDQKERPRSS